MQSPSRKVHLPDVSERNAQARLPALDQRGSGGARAVVGDHDLEAPVGLMRQRRQDRLERVLAIVGRDDDGDEFGHVFASVRRPSLCGCDDLA
jgi:hypothetical protein